MWDLGGCGGDRSARVVRLLHVEAVLSVAFSSRRRLCLDTLHGIRVT